VIFEAPRAGPPAPPHAADPPSRRRDGTGFLKPSSAPGSPCSTAWPWRSEYSPGEQSERYWPNGVWVVAV